MKITELDLRAEGKRYKCGNRIFTVKDGDLVDIESNTYLRKENISITELLKMDFEEVKEMKNPYKRVNNGEMYYFVSERGGIENFKEFTDCSDNKLFKSLNYFNNKEYAKYIAFKETLMRRMDKFAWEHNAKVVGWGDCNQPKHHIVLNNYCDKNLEVSSCFSLQSNNIYFTSKEIAEMALEKFKDDLMKLYTWKFDF